MTEVETENKRHCEGSCAIGGLLLFTLLIPLLFSVWNLLPMHVIFVGLLIAGAFFNFIFCIWCLPCGGTAFATNNACLIQSFVTPGAWGCGLFNFQPWICFATQWTATGANVSACCTLYGQIFTFGIFAGASFLVGLVDFFLILSLVFFFYGGIRWTLHQAGIDWEIAPIQESNVSNQSNQSNQSKQGRNTYKPVDTGQMKF